MNVPMMLSVQQERFIEWLMNNQSFVLELGWGENGIDRIVDMHYTNTYYGFDRLMLKDLHQNAKKVGLVL